MGRKIVVVADGNMYEFNSELGSIRQYNADRMERDIELGYSVIVRPATKGEREFVERQSFYRRPIVENVYELELEGVL